MYAEGWRIEQYARTAFQIGREYDLLSLRPSTIAKESFFLLLPLLTEAETLFNGGLVYQNHAIKIRVSRSSLLSSLTIKDITEIFPEPNEDGIKEDDVHQEAEDINLEKKFARSLPHHYVLQKISKFLWCDNYVELAASSLRLLDSSSTESAGIGLDEGVLHQSLKDEQTIIPAIKYVSLDNADIMAMRSELLELVKAHQVNGTLTKTASLSV